jgi:predicted RNA-binding protein Jag
MNPDYETIEYIQKTLTELLTIAGFRTKVEYEQSLLKGLIFHISVDSPQMLIGKQGANLLALEHLLFAMVNRHFKDLPESIHFTLDIDDYRSNREYQIKQMVKEFVMKLKYSKEPIYLPVMPRHERKFTHNYIQQQFPHLITESVGEEPNRQIVLKI